MTHFRFFLSICLLLATGMLYADQWTIKESEAGNTLFIGDLHADANALHLVLRNSGAIDKSGKLTDKFDDVVFVGDYVGKGAHSIEVLDTLMAFEKLARENGKPRPHFLLGNHELRMLAGDFRYISESDLKKLAGEGISSPAEAFSAEGKYGKWLAQQPAIVQIGRDLVSHAGLSPEMLDYSPKQINQLVNDWIAFLLGTGPQPPIETAWVVGLKNIEKRKFTSTGPIWTHAMAPSTRKRLLSADGQLTTEQIQEYLRRFGADHIVLGHNPTKDKRIHLVHKMFGELVVLIDSGISSATGGRPSSLMRFEGKYMAQVWKRPKKISKWIKRLRLPYRPLTQKTQRIIENCADRLIGLSASSI